MVGPETGKETAVAVSEGNCSTLALTESQSAYVDHSGQMLAHLEHAAAILRESGAMRADSHVHNGMRKEKRRRRNLAAMDCDMSKALVRRRDAEDAKRRSQLALAAELNDMQAKARETARQIVE